jgi:phosphohistidine phosphatase
VKRLLLLRHAKAIGAEQPLADIARPLAERGKRDAERIGERLQRHQTPPGRMLASPAARTVQTARLAAAAFGQPPEAIVIEPRLYLAELATLRTVITAQDSAIESLLLVGHNPGLSELVHELLPAFDVDDLPTGAVVVLEYTAATAWTELEGAAGRLAYYDFPKNLRAPITNR